jgi:hypothetical protein
VAVELDLGLAVFLGQAEMVEQVGARALAVAAEGGAQVLDEGLGVDLLLEVDRRRLDDQVGPVGEVLGAPDELDASIYLARLPRS